MAALIPFSVLAILLSFQLSAAVQAPAPAHKRGAIVGDWRPIKNLANPTVVRVAKYAVTMYNGRVNSRLGYELVRVIKGEIQVVAGLNYRLVIEARGVDKTVPPIPGHLEAVVYAGLGGKALKLISLKTIRTPNY